MIPKINPAYSVESVYLKYFERLKNALIGAQEFINNCETRLKEIEV